MALKDCFGISTEFRYDMEISEIIFKEAKNCVGEKQPHFAHLQSRRSFLWVEQTCKYLDNGSACQGGDLKQLLHNSINKTQQLKEKWPTHQHITLS